MSTTPSDYGKGSKRRDSSVTDSMFGEAWKRIFAKRAKAKRAKQRRARDSKK